VAQGLLEVMEAALGCLAASGSPVQLEVIEPAGLARRGFEDSSEAVAVDASAVPEEVTAAVANYPPVGGMQLGELLGGHLALLWHGRAPCTIEEVYNPYADSLIPSTSAAALIAACIACARWANRTEAGGKVALSRPLPVWATQ